MGSTNSKTGQDPAAIIQKNESCKDIDGNPDPRSPTPEITRTPLQDKPGSKHGITKNMDLRKALENSKGDNKLIHNNPILSAVIKNHLQSFDPRSPTQDFERTPIIIASKLSDSNDEPNMLKMADSCGSPNLQNDTLENNNEEKFHVSPELVPKKLCDDFYDLSLNESLKDEPLGSSTASNEAIEINIPKESPKPTQLLETNFDYIENGETVGDSKEMVKNIPVYKLINDDPRSPSLGIDRTPIVVSKTNESLEDNVEAMSDDLLIKVLENANTEIKEAMLNKKTSDGILVYEDEDNIAQNALINDTPKKSKSVNNSGSRTPLSCMKNKTEANHGRSKSANTLLDPKTKKRCQLAKRVSHIPRLKSLSKQKQCVPMGSSVSLKNTNVNGDCENTPPHLHRDKWDKDNSIVL